MTGPHLLPQIATRRATDTPHARAYVLLGDDGAETDVLTFGELHARATAVASVLGERCAPGDRALLVLPQGLDVVVAFLGCLYARVVAVPLNSPRRTRAAQTSLGIVTDCRPRAVLTLGSMRAGLEPVLDVPVWITVDALDDRAVGAPVAPAGSVGRPAPEDLAFLQYTSGSTAAPKGVMVTHANLVANQEMIRRSFGHDARSTVVGWAPFFHDQGLIGNLLQPLYVGATSVVMSPMAFIRRPESWLTAIDRYRAHTSGGPNFAFDACVARARAGRIPADLDLRSWRVAFNGAEPIRAQTLREFATVFAGYGFDERALFPCYGLAEATLLVTASRPRRGPRTALLEPQEPDAEGAGAFGDPDAVGSGAGSAVGGAAGMAAGGAVGSAPGGALGSTVEGGERIERVGCGTVVDPGQVRVVDPRTSRVCPRGRLGEIWVSGDHVARGYWENPAATEAVFGAHTPDVPGRRFLRTGDLGVFVQDELYVAGRIRDLIIVRGRNYYPQDLELAAAAWSAHLEPDGGAAFLCADRLVLVQEVARRVPRTVDASSLVAGIRAAVMQEHRLTVNDVVLVRPGQLPRTSSGKVMRRATRALYPQPEGLRRWTR